MNANSLPHDLRALRALLTPLLILVMLSLMIALAISRPHQASAHGGIPRVLALQPPRASHPDFWVTDTLGLFRGQALNNASASEPLERQRAWSWLCDDAVDLMLGVDELALVSPEVMVAVARSGVYRSDDRGCSFERLNSPINEHAIGSISIHPAEREQLALFTENTGAENSVWWTSDSGRQWSQSDLVIEGVIQSMWRDPNRPKTLWVSHTQGLSYSENGGQTFNEVNVLDYSLEVSPREVRLLGGGEVGGRTLLWASVDRYPTSSLLMSDDQGLTWREIHRAEDSYDQLAITQTALWVSTPFEGLFIYEIGEQERAHSEDAWNGAWRQRDATFVSCLTPDPQDPDVMWACGRAEPTGWLVARSRDLGERWEVLMSSYEIAAGSDWGCADDSPSVSACADRCLDRTCDPSGLEMGSEMGSEIGGGGESEREGEGEAERTDLESEREAAESVSSGGCDTFRDTSRCASHHTSHHYPIGLTLLWIYLMLISSNMRVRRCDSTLTRQVKS